MPSYEGDCKTAWMPVIPLRHANLDAALAPLPEQHPYQPHTCKRRGVHQRHVCRCRSWADTEGEQDG